MLPIEEVVKTIEQETLSGQEFLPIIGPAKGAFLEELVKKYCPKTIVEVGTLVGYSALRISRALRKCDGGKLITIEVDPKTAERAREHFQVAGVEKYITLLVGDAKEKLQGISGPIDFLFLDAAKDEYLTYLKLAEPKLADHVVILADNVLVFAGELAEYLAYVRERYQSTTHTFPSFLDGGQAKDAMEVSVKGA